MVTVSDRVTPTGKTVSVVALVAETELFPLLAVHKYSPASSRSTLHISKMDSTKLRFVITLS